MRIQGASATERAIRSACIALVTLALAGLPPAVAAGSGGKGVATLVVPDDYPTIQEAVNHASPGSVVLIKPGVYRESVSVPVGDITIRGVDRFRTILHGEDNRSNGFIVDGHDDVTIANLTVRNYTSNGIYYTNSDGYRISRVDAIKNRVYGLYAFDSYDGVIDHSFAWGSGDAGIYIGECLECEGIIRNVHVEWNLIGYSGTNATGVVIKDSEWVNNAVGIMPNTLPYEADGPNRGGLITNNHIAHNNNATIPAASIWTTYGVPTGTGVWLLGVQNNIVTKNRFEDHDRYAVLVSFTTDVHLPMNNEITENVIRDSRMYDLAWDGTGAGNCFSDNDYDGQTGPPAIETVYSCDNPPLPGVLYPPVFADVVASLATGANRDEGEVPEPKRPHCQRGRPGCDRS